MVVVIVPFLSVMISPPPSCSSSGGISMTTGAAKSLGQFRHASREFPIAPSLVLVAESSLKIVVSSAA